jgi:hypothetical protein
MGENELAAIVTFTVWGLMLAGAVKLFGARRVAWFLVILVVLAISVAFRSLGAITDRRY